MGIVCCVGGQLVQRLGQRERAGLQVSTQRPTGPDDRRRHRHRGAGRHVVRHSRSPTGTLGGPPRQGLKPVRTTGWASMTACTFGLTASVPDRPPTMNSGMPSFHPVRRIIWSAHGRWPAKQRSVGSARPRRAGDQRRTAPERPCSLRLRRHRWRAAPEPTQDCRRLSAPNAHRRRDIGRRCAAEVAATAEP
jgi:hypothetical protein